MITADNYEKIILTLSVALALIACNTKQTDSKKTPDNLSQEAPLTSQSNLITDNSVDGVKIGEKITEFMTFVLEYYEVKKGTMQMEGDDYDIYEVFENEKNIFTIEPDGNDPQQIYRIWAYSPKYKTEKGTAVGSTLSEIKSLCII